MLRVHGCAISYYTGKLEAYLRYRGIPYEQLPTVGYEREIEAGAGAVQMPVVRLDDGRWLSDSTPSIAWFESEQEAPTVYPEDRALRFVALLLEDYADEYLWRPAMHYRWSHQRDREYASAAIADELLTGVRLPRFAKRILVTRRQLRGFVRGDGVTDSTRAHVEQGYLNALDLMGAILAERPFLLGSTPTIADFGFMPESPLAGEPVMFNASSSIDPDGAIVAYAWDLNGDGTTDATEVISVFIFPSPGTFNASLTVTDDDGNSDTLTDTIEVQ